MKSTAKAKQANAISDIPLLEEVNELLSKERNLMNLKVIEQHVEAKEWKDKYETLVKKLSDDTMNPQKVTAFEVAADVSCAPQSKSWRNDVEKQLYLLPSSEMPWYLDLSGTSLTVNDLHRILMFPKSNNYKQVTVLNFHDCGIDDSCAKLLPHLLRFPNIEAIDLSCNDVAEQFQIALLAAVEERRLKLQYFLLHGNMQLSNFPMEKFLHHLSGTVWGLTFSLADVANTFNMAAGTGGGKGKAPGSSASALVPKHSARFLKHLNHVLDPQSGQDAAKKRAAEQTQPAQTLAHKKGLKKGQKQHDEFLQPHRGAGGSQGAPQALCVLGLMHAILSDDSIGQLETTLRLTISTLTDLDLSYSFTSIKGAKVVGKMLRSRPCQLVRLNLMGNALGDGATASFICPGLQASKTLTFLDLKSNNLTDIGLASLAHALKGKLTFRRLLLEGNNLSLAALTGARALLLKSGAPDMLVDFGVCLAAPVVAPTPHEQGHNLAVMDTPEAVFAVPGQVSVALEPSGGHALLYSIESQNIKISLPKTSSDVSSTEAIDQKVAEAISGAVRLTWNMSVCDFGSAGEHDVSGMLRLFSKAVICWEVTCVTASNQVTLLATKTLLPNACLPVGTSVACSATVPKPPFRSKLEVCLKLVHSKAGKTTYKTLRVNAYGLQVFGVPTNFESSHVLYGGDMPAWSSCSNALLGAEMTPPRGVPAGFVVARRVQWVGQHSQDIRLCFRSKLSATYNVSDVANSSSTSIMDSTWKLAEGSVIGYSWCLCRCQTLGGAAVIASGDVFQSRGRVDRQDEEGGSVSDSLLQPWLWRSQDVSVAEAATNDVFILCVKVSANPPVRNLSNRCSVQVSDCGFYVSGENYEATQRDAVFESRSNPAVLFSSFNSAAAIISI